MIGRSGRTSSTGEVAPSVSGSDRTGPIRSARVDDGGQDDHPDSPALLVYHLGDPDSGGLGRTEPPADRRRVQVRSVVLGLLTLEVVVLAVTGVLLVLGYRPASSVGAHAFGIDGRPYRAIDRIRRAHDLLALATIPTSVAAGVLLVWDHVGMARAAISRARFAIGTSMLAVVVGVIVTGAFLPWDQLGLWAVTVGTDIRGYRPIIDGQVRFVIQDGHETSTQTVVRWLGIHVTFGGPVLIALLVAAWVVHLRRRRTVDR